LTVQQSFTFLETIVFAFGASVGFALALVLFAGIRERLSLSEIPKAFEGTAIALITAGLLSLAFLGFAGLVK
jgi:electron transport complex protein RnfA